MRIPSTNELLKAYADLQSVHVHFNEEDIITLATWSRFDPRLMEQVILYLSQKWVDENPIKIKDLAVQSGGAQALAVILEHVSIKLKSNLFDQWKDLICHKLPQVAYQRFFIGFDKPASKRALVSVTQAVEPFKKWGFLEDELIFNKLDHYPPGTYSIETRKQILKNLLLEKKRIRISHYLTALHNSLSRRQALRDLESFPFVKSDGTKKSRTYCLKKLMANMPRVKERIRLS